MTRQDLERLKELNEILHYEKTDDNFRETTKLSRKLIQALERSQEALKSVEIERQTLSFDKNYPEAYGKHIGSGTIDMDLFKAAILPEEKQ